MANALEIIKQFIELPANKFEIPKEESLVEALKIGKIRTPYEQDWATPLILAAKQGNLAVVKAYVELEIAKYDRDKTRKTPLMHALENGHTEVSDALIKSGNGDFFSFDIDKKNTLMYAINANDLSCMRAILEEKTEVVFSLNHEDKWDYTPLMIAVKNGNMSAVEILLEQRGIEINRQRPWGIHRDRVGESALDMSFGVPASRSCGAVEGGNQQIAKLLEAYGAKPAWILNDEKAKQSTVTGKPMITRGPQFEVEEPQQQTQKTSKCVVM